MKCRRSITTPQSRPAARASARRMRPLIDQANERAAHADDVVIGVRREDDDALGKGAIGGAADVAGALEALGLAAGPAGDRLGQLAEDVDVDVIRRAVRRDQILEAVL